MAAAQIRALERIGLIQSALSHDPAPGSGVEGGFAGEHQQPRAHQATAMVDADLELADVGLELGAAGTI
jgi:hypothetical protein